MSKETESNEQTIVTSLVADFERERIKEDRRLEQLESVRISPWNPRRTMQWDRDRCEKRLMNLKRWTMSWWSRRSFRVVWNDDAEGYQLPSFTVESM